jgi:hypothetical protein
MFTKQKDDEEEVFIDEHSKINPYDGVRHAEDYRLNYLIQLLFRFEVRDQQECLDFHSCM